MDADAFEQLLGCVELVDIGLPVARLEADAHVVEAESVPNSSRRWKVRANPRRAGDGDRGGDVAPIDVHLAVIRTLQTLTTLNSVVLPAPFGRSAR